MSLKQSEDNPEVIESRLKSIENALSKSLLMNGTNKSLYSFYFGFMKKTTTDESSSYSSPSITTKIKSTSGPGNDNNQYKPESIVRMDIDDLEWFMGFLESNIKISDNRNNKKTEKPSKVDSIKDDGSATSATGGGGILSSFFSSSSSSENSTLPQTFFLASNTTPTNKTTHQSYSLNENRITTIKNSLLAAKKLVLHHESRSFENSAINEKKKTSVIDLQLFRHHLEELLFELTIIPSFQTTTASGLTENDLAKKNKLKFEFESISLENLKSCSLHYASQKHSSTLLLDTVVSFMTHCNAPNLKELSLSSCHLTHSDIDSLAPLLPQSIVYLHLSDNQISEFPRGLKELKNLKSLNVSKNKLDNLESMPSIPSLDFLNLSQNMIDSLYGISNCENIIYLELNDNKIWDVYEVHKLTLLKNLKHVSVKGNPFTKVPDHRINMLNYFKLKALDMVFDGKPTTTEEKNIIRSMNPIVNINTVVTSSTTGLSSATKNTPVSQISTKKEASPSSKTLTISMSTTKASNRRQTADEAVTAKSPETTIGNLSNKFTRSITTSPSLTPGTNSNYASNNLYESTSNRIQPSSALQGFSPKYAEKLSIDVLSSSPKFVPSARKLSSTSSTQTQKRSLPRPSSQYEKENHDNTQIVMIETPTSEPAAILSAEKSDIPLQLTASHITHAQIKPLQISKLPYTRYLQHNNNKKQTESYLSTSIGKDTLPDSKHHHNKYQSENLKFQAEDVQGVRSGSVAELSKITLPESTKHGPKTLPPLSVVGAQQTANKATIFEMGISASASEGGRQLRSPQAYLSRAKYLFSRPSSSTSTFTRSGAYKTSSIESNGYSITVSDSLKFGNSQSYVGHEHQERFGHEGNMSVNEQRPYMDVTNALELYFNYHIFQDDDEQMISWIPSGFIKQLPYRITEYKNEIGIVDPSSIGSSEDQMLSWKSYSFRPSTNRYTPRMSFIPIQKLDYLQPRENPGYVLTTNKRIYIFVPKSIKNKIGNYPSLVQHALRQVTYENPADFLQLIYTFDLQKDIARADIGPQFQYVTLHVNFDLNYLKEHHASAAMYSNVTSHSSQLSRLLSLTLLIRDRKRVEFWVNEMKKISVFVSLDTLWFTKELQEKVYLSHGPKKILYNIWQVLSLTQLGHRQTQTKGYLTHLYDVVNATMVATSLKRTHAPSNDDITSTVNIQGEEDQKTVHSAPIKYLDEENNPSLHAYQLVSWVHVDHSNHRISNRPCSLMATDKYLYLFVERLDIWPPPLLPMDRVLDAALLNQRVRQVCSSDLLDDKGLLCDLIYPTSDPCLLRVMPLNRLVRCERWKTFRWNFTKSIQQVTRVPLSIAARFIQSGFIGQMSVDELNGKVYTHYQSGQYPSIKQVLKATRGETCSSGWPWMIRLFFILEKEDQINGSNTGLSENITEKQGKKEATFSNMTEFNYQNTDLNTENGDRLSSEQEEVWLDLCFTNIGETDFLLNTLKSLHPEIGIVLGDD